MFKIGLTGGICSGKTFILNIFKELNCYTVKADDIARNIIFSNKPEIIKEIVKVFGESVFDEKNCLIKEEFSRMLFEEPERRIFINNLIHPLVREERKILYDDIKDSEAYDFFVYESALLVESGIYKDFDKIIVVYTSHEEQIRRLMERDNLSREDADQRIKSQFPLNEKLKVAHYTVDSTGTYENAKAKTLEAYHLMKKDFNFS